MRPGFAQAVASSSRVRGGGGGGVPNPLALYPSYSRNRIMWAGGAFSEAALPANPSGSATATTAAQLATAMTGSNKTITVSGALDTVDLGGSCGHDIEVVLTAGSSVKSFSSSSGARVRFRGPGKMGVLALVTPLTDFVFDGIAFAPDTLGSAVTDMGYMYQVARVAFLNCVGRGRAGTAPCFSLYHGCNNILLANCNFAVDSALVDNKWVMRITAGAGDPQMQQLLYVDCTMQSYNQAFRFSTETSGGLIQKVQIDHSTLVNTYACDNVIHSQDLNPIGTDEIYMRSCTSVMGSTFSLSMFGGVPAKAGGGARDAKFYVVDHTYLAHDSSVVQKSNLQSIMSAGAALSPIWDLQYLGTAASPTSTSGAAFVYDTSVMSKWAHDGTATGWPTIRSPLTGLVVGADPNVL